MTESPTSPITLNLRYGIARLSGRSVPTVDRYLRRTLPMLEDSRRVIENALREMGREDLICPGPVHRAVASPADPPPT